MDIQLLCDIQVSNMAKFYKYIISALVTLIVITFLLEFAKGLLKICALQWTNRLGRKFDAKDEIANSFISNLFNSYFLMRFRN